MDWCGDTVDTLSVKELQRPRWFGRAGRQSNRGIHLLKISKSFCGALVLVCGFGLPTFSAAAAGATASDDKASIEALETRLHDALVAKDVNGVMAVYAPGTRLFVFDVTPPRQHVGWQDYKKDWQDLLAAYSGPVSFTISDLDITVVGSVAYSHSIQDGQFTSKDGAKTHLVARVTDVYRKIKGQWLIVQEHVSVPVDLATQKPDLLSKP
jgi:ketosteroid isomerase-like protein